MEFKRCLYSQTAKPGQDICVSFAVFSKQPGIRIAVGSSDDETAQGVRRAAFWPGSHHCPLSSLRQALTM